MAGEEKGARASQGLRQFKDFDGGSVMAAVSRSKKSSLVATTSYDWKDDKTSRTEG